MWYRYQLVCSKVDTHWTLVWGTEQSRVYCSPDSSTWYLLLVSECELGRLLTYLRTLTNLGKVCWQFLLCVSMLTKYSHSAKKESRRGVCVCVCVYMYVGRQSWVSWKGTSKDFGDGPGLHDAWMLQIVNNDNCILFMPQIVNKDNCILLLLQIWRKSKRLQKGSLCCLPCKCLDSGHGNSTDTHKGCRGVF